MCRPKPYPRCSNHARKQLEAAQTSGDAARIQIAQEAYNHTPEGIQTLRDAGQVKDAERYQTQRTQLIQKAKAHHAKTPLRVALDLDETSGGFINSLRESLAQRQGLTPEQAAELMPTPQHYSFVESGWFKNTEEFLEAFHYAENNGVYRNMKTFEGVQETIQTLVTNRDVEIHVVTARNIQWNEETKQWLKQHRIPFKSITHTEEKQNVPNIDVYIDDSDKQITTLQKHGKTVIAFTNPYNQSIESKYRVSAWKDIPAVLQLIKQGQNTEK